MKRHDARQTGERDVLRRVLRALQVIRAVVRAQLGASGEGEFADQVCSLVVKEGGYRLAWIGYAESNKARTVRPVAHAGFAEGYLESADIRWSDTPRGHGPTGTAIRTNSISVARDIHNDPRFEPWRSDAIERGYASSIALPLHLDGACMGALNIYAVEPNAFDDEEVSLLTELADMVSQAIAMFRVRDERARAEADRRRLESELQHARRLESLGRLAGGIAHDFNNLLAVTMNFAAIASRQLSSDHPVQSELRGILESAQHGASLTRQLLTFSSRDTTSADVLDVNAVLLAMRLVVERTVGATVAVEMRLAADVPAVRMGQTHFEQILLNAASNARDAMPSGGTFSIVTSRSDVTPAEAALRPKLAAGSYLRVVLSDDGVGMPEDVAARAFEPFYTTKDEAHGTGLGLAIVYGAVQQAGGYVRIASAPGKGTRLEILLPASDGRAAE